MEFGRKNTRSLKKWTAGTCVAWRGPHSWMWRCGGFGETCYHLLKMVDAMWWLIKLGDLNHWWEIAQWWFLGIWNDTKVHNECNILKLWNVCEMFDVLQQFYSFLNLNTYFFKQLCWEMNCKILINKSVASTFWHLETDGGMHPSWTHVRKVDKISYNLLFGHFRWYSH